MPSFIQINTSGVYKLDPTPTGTAGQKLNTNFEALVTADAAKLAKASNLSDLTNAATARTNLGLGTAATQASTAFATADVAPPVGSVLAWMKNMSGTPGLPAGWVECNGQTLADAGSVYNGQLLPDLNGNVDSVHKFLRGATTSGTTGGSQCHSHCLSLGLCVGYTSVASSGMCYTSAVNGVYDAGSYVDTQNHEPPFMDVVWIIRVK